MIAPTLIEQIGPELAIHWSDDLETFLGLEQLRRACPCAGCAGEPDVLGRRLVSRAEYSEESFILRGYSPVGGYALQLRWGDGHATGIYSFDYLRRLGEAEQ